MANYFDNEKLIELVNLNLGYVSNFNELSRISLNITELKSLMNLAVSTAIQQPIGYANSNDLIDDGTSFYLLEIWKIKDADEANNIPLYTVKEIS